MQNDTKSSFSVKKKVKKFLNDIDQLSPIKTNGKEDIILK